MVKTAQMIIIERRNQEVRDNPALLKERLEELMIQKRTQKKQAGFFVRNCLTTWKPSSLPLHVEIGYFFLNSKHPIRRLVSLKDPSDANINVYALKELKAVQSKLAEKAVNLPSPNFQLDCTAQQHEVQTKRILDHEKVVTHWKDEEHWWEAIVQHNLDKRTREEANRVLAGFGSLENVNRPTANRIASLVNDEVVDIKLLEKLTGYSGDDDENSSFPALANYPIRNNEAPTKVDKISKSANTAHLQSLVRPLSSADSTSSTSTVKTIYADSQVAEPSHTTRSSAEGLGIGLSRREAPQEDLHVGNTTAVGVLESGTSGYKTCSHEAPEEVQHTTVMSAGGSSSPRQLPGPNDPQPLDFYHIPWTYITATEYDKTFLENGIWLFERPLTYFRPQPKAFVAESDRLQDVPVVVSHNPSSNGSANASFNKEILVLKAARSPSVDLRCVEKHPDFLSPSKLAEYQAVESAGFRVWRHDRNTLVCRKAGCLSQCSDWDYRTLICNGCGPKTIIRYCSHEHKFQDLGEHWKECGSPALLMEQVIDHTTEPPEFGYLCPAIRDRHNRKSFKYLWQSSYAQTFFGHYAIVHPDTKRTMPLFWPHMRDAEKACEMDRRIERCLNIAFFDHSKTIVIVYLYRMVRRLLQLSKFWNGPVATQLFRQFYYQFGVGIPYVCAVATNDPICECEWVGPKLREVDHEPGCRRHYKEFGENFNGLGIKAFVEKMEAKYWILRAWRQQLAANSTWVDRVMGKGFPGVKKPGEGWAPKLGPGWLGWGARADNIWEEMA
ncbi:MAG: hypothetical protein Q9167_005123 [Letrouitia subvulpina]